MSFSDIEELDFILEKVDTLTNEALKDKYQFPCKNKIKLLIPFKINSG
tara:strand:- start:347 stop:490 length:144 start_codon:yes stop_codon:yes gene_type:complete